jgi:hypothetical protein
MTEVPPTDELIRRIRLSAGTWFNPREHNDLEELIRRLLKAEAALLLSRSAQE